MNWFGISSIVISIFITSTAMSQQKNCNTVFDCLFPCKPIHIEKIGDTNYCQLEDSNCAIPEAHGYPDGYWKITLGSNSVIIQEFLIQNGKLEGVLIERYLSGKLEYETVYVNGVPNGKSIAFDENGRRVIDGYYTDNQFVGITYEYWDNGKMAQMSSWKAGDVFEASFNLHWDFEGNVISEEDFRTLWFCP